MSEWQPIETAPKDGTIIELMEWSPEMPCVYVAWWCPGYNTADVGSPYYDESWEGHCWVLNDAAKEIIEEDWPPENLFWRALSLPDGCVLNDQKISPRI